MGIKLPEPPGPGKRSLSSFGRKITEVEKWRPKHSPSARTPNTVGAVADKIVWKSILGEATKQKVTMVDRETSIVSTHLVPDHEGLGDEDIDTVGTKAVPELEKSGVGGQDVVVEEAGKVGLAEGLEVLIVDLSGGSPVLGDTHGGLGHLDTEERSGGEAIDEGQDLGGGPVQHHGESERTSGSPPPQELKYVW